MKSLMKRSATGAVVATLLLAVSCSSSEQPAEATAAKPAAAKGAEGAVATSGAELGKWTMDFDAAKTLAAEKEVPILINFTGSDWCGWCKLMDREVFSKAEWQQYAAESLVLVWIDFPRDKALVPMNYVGRNSALQKEFGVRGYPTYVVLGSDGKSRLGQLGAAREATPAWFIEQVKGVAAKK